MKDWKEFRVPSILVPSYRLEVALGRRSSGFSHAKRCSPGGSWLRLCTLAIIWLYLKHDPGCHAVLLQGTLRGSLLPIAVLTDQSLPWCCQDYAAACSKERFCECCLFLCPSCVAESCQGSLQAELSTSSFVWWSTMIPTYHGSCLQWDADLKQKESSVHACLIPMTTAVPETSGATENGSAEQCGFGKDV